MVDSNDQLARATKSLMLKEPFYGLFLIMLNKQWVKGMGTAGVSKNGINMQLSIDPVFWDNLSDDYRVGILTHEVLHIAFQHLTLRDKYPDKKLFNIAADLEINQYIERHLLPGGSYPSMDKFKQDVQIFHDAIEQELKDGKITEEEAREKKSKLPFRVLFLEDYPELNMKQKAGTDYYYKELEKAAKNRNCPNLNDVLDGNSPCSSDYHHHKTWKEFSQLGEAEKRMIEKQVEYQLAETADQVQKSRGTIPGHLKDIIDAINKKEPPKFNWRAYLRNFVGGSTQTTTKKTRRKKSKRYPGNPGLKIMEKLHVVVAIDTSGSVSNDELKEFMHEIYHMHRTGTEVTIIQADTDISDIRRYKSSEDGKIEVFGRGGTSFTPAVDYFNKNIRSCSCLIYFTDGEAPAPQNPPRGRCLWVLSSRSHECDHLPGKIIKLN